MDELNESEQLAHALMEFATEVRTLGYSPLVTPGCENRFLELSERMIRRAGPKRLAGKRTPAGSYGPHPADAAGATLADRTERGSASSAYG